MASRIAQAAADDAGTKLAQLCGRAAPVGLDSLNFDFECFLARRAPEGQDIGKETPKRVTLRERSAAQPARNRSCVLAKLEMLRGAQTPDARAQFFKEVDEQLQERRLAHLGSSECGSIIRRNRELVKTPLVRTPSPGKSVMEDAHVVAVAARRKQLRRERQERFMDLVERTRGIGTVVEDPAMSQKMLRATRCSHWAPLLVHHRLLRSLHEAVGAHWADRQREVVQKRRRHFMASISAIIVFQRLWRRVRWRILLRRKKGACTAIVAFLRGIDRVKVQFGFAMRRLLLVVRKLQARHRALRAARRQRRLMGCLELRKHIDVELQRLDTVVRRMKKEKERHLREGRAAIKARQHVFEARAEAAEAAAHAAAKDRAVLRALRNDSVMGLVAGVLEDREAKYDQLLLQYGRKLFDKYQAQVNSAKLLERKMSQYSNLVRQRSIAELQAPTSNGTRYIRSARLQPPHMLLAITSDDAKVLFECDVMAAATEDFFLATAAQYGAPSEHAMDDAQQLPLEQSHLASPTRQGAVVSAAQRGDAAGLSSDHSSGPSDFTDRDV